MDPVPHHHGDARPSTPPPLPGGAEEEEEEGEEEEEEEDELEGQPPALLSLEQLRVSRGSNDYTDSPSATAPASATRGSGVEEPPSESAGEDEACLGLRAPVASQPKADPSPRLLLKPRAVQASHGCHCQACGRCVCPACTQPRPLPSCWACGRRCLCSARATVDCVTCACCVHALFYHCSGDEEAACADRPFSCAEDRWCARWTALSLLTLLLPCLLCYAPARACLAGCQACYGCAARRGCRCRRPRLAPVAPGDAPA